MKKTIMHAVVYRPLHFAPVMPLAIAYVVVSRKALRRTVQSFPRREFVPCFNSRRLASGRQVTSIGAKPRYHECRDGAISV